MAWRHLTDEQWEAVSKHLPKEKPSPKGGRPRVDDRRCLEDILWILWTGYSGAHSSRNLLRPT